MNSSKRIKSTASYLLDVPIDVVEQVEDYVDSFWRPNEEVLLQTSSYKRIEGPQVSARERLEERLQREGLLHVLEEKIYPQTCPDVAAASGNDKEGIRWIYCYAVWPDLTILITISGGKSLEKKYWDWAIEAVRSIRRS